MMMRQRLVRCALGIGVLYSHSKPIACTEETNSNASGEYIINSTVNNNSLHIVYDARTRCPKYVVERLTRLGAEEDVIDKTRPPFRAETLVSEPFRVSCIANCSLN